MLTCRSFFDAFGVFRRQILETVLLRELGPGIFGLAVETYYCQRARADYTARNLRSSSSPDAVAVSVARSPLSGVGVDAGAKNSSLSPESNSATKGAGSAFSPKYWAAKSKNASLSPGPAGVDARTPSQLAHSVVGSSVSSGVSRGSARTPSLVVETMRNNNMFPEGGQAESATPLDLTTARSSLAPATPARSSVSPRVAKAIENRQSRSPSYYSGDVLDNGNGYEALYEFCAGASLRREKLLENSGRLAHMKLDDDPPIDVEELVMTHYEVDGFYRELVSADIIEGYANSGTCGADYVRIVSKPEPERRRLLWAALYAWLIGVASCEIVQEENDDDEMEVVFDVLEVFVWNLMYDLLEEEFEEVRRPRGVFITLTVRYLLGLLDVEVEDRFTVMTFRRLQPNSEFGYLPESKRYRFVDPASPHFGSIWAGHAVQAHTVPRHIGGEEGAKSGPGLKKKQSWIFGSRSRPPPELKELNRKYAVWCYLRWSQRLHKKLISHATLLI